MSTKQYQQYPGYYGLEHYPYSYVGNQSQQGQPQQGQGQLQQFQPQMQQPQQMAGQQMQSQGQYGQQSYNQYYMMNNQSVPQGLQPQQPSGQQPSSQTQQAFSYQQPQIPQQPQQGNSAVGAANGNVEYMQHYPGYGAGSIGQGSYAQYPMYSNVPGSGPASMNASGSSGVSSSTPLSQMFDLALNQRHAYRGASGSGANAANRSSDLNASLNQQQQQQAVAQSGSPNASIVGVRATNLASNAVPNTATAAKGARRAGNMATDDSLAPKSKPDDLETPGPNSSLGQVQPPGTRPRVTTTMWEDEKTLCYQVDANDVSVVRRADNDMINGTKLLNVAQMTRGRRDGILKLEKLRHVVKIGSMHLKGVWIPFERALAMAQREGIVDALYPLFVRDISGMIQNGVTPASHPASTSSAAAAGAATGKGVSLATNGVFLTPQTSAAAATLGEGSFYQQQYPSQYPSGSGASNGTGTAGSEASSNAAQTMPQQQQRPQQQQTQQGSQQGPLHMFGYSQPHYNQYYGQYNQGASGSNGNGANGGGSYQSYQQEPYGQYPGYSQGNHGASGLPVRNDNQADPKASHDNQQVSPGQKGKESDAKVKV